jgi:membrane-associated protein
MDTLHQLVNFVLHLDQYLFAFVSANGAWAYVLLFAIIFCETGLVITPFLPGDSLLFAAGSIAANTGETFNIHILFLLLVTASTLGNGLNYLIGRYIGPKIFSSKQSWLLNKRHLEEAHAFYERHGGKTIILARFIPIIRTFAPFVAGIGYMSHRRFFAYNLSSAILWIGTLLYTSYFFGNLPFVKNHFSTVILGIIAISLMPPAIGMLRRANNKIT